MPDLVITERARHGIEKCRAFLKAKNPDASQRAAQAIKQRLQILMDHPEAGRLINPETGLREWLIPFGASGYVALYQLIPKRDLILILAFRHQREAGY